MMKLKNDEKLLNCYYSLCTTINAGGGSGPSIYALKEMSAMDLIRLIAPNNILFIYEEEKQ
jgi:hypothetical protein